MTLENKFSGERMCWAILFKIIKEVFMEFSYDPAAYSAGDRPQKFIYNAVLTTVKSTNLNLIQR